MCVGGACLEGASAIFSLLSLVFLCFSLLLHLLFPPSCKIRHAPARKRYLRLASKLRTFAPLPGRVGQISHGLVLTFVAAKATRTTETRIHPREVNAHPAVCRERKLCTTGRYRDEDRSYAHQVIVQDRPSPFPRTRGRTDSKMNLSPQASGPPLSGIQYHRCYFVSRNVEASGHAQTSWTIRTPIDARG